MSKAGSKYYPLYQYFSEKDVEFITLTFSEIESILGRDLPYSAKADRGWWGNRANGPSHAKAWMQAKYEVSEIDMAAGQITFRKVKLEYRVEASEKGEPQWDGELVEGLRRHMQLTQGELAEELGVRQQTISEWERGAYLPSRATSKYLTLVAERERFIYQVENPQSKDESI